MWTQNGDDPSLSSNLQVVISSSSSDPDGISTQTQQEPTMPTFEEDQNMRKDVLRYSIYWKSIIYDDKWDDGKSLFDACPHMVRVPITDNGGTPLHLAVSENRESFVKGLVNFKHVTPQDLEIPNEVGNTAFCLAAITGKLNFLKIMMTKNPNLPLIHGEDEMLPVHLAVLSGQLQIVEHLSSWDLLFGVDFKDIERLLFMIINNNMYDVACKLIDTYPRSLSFARDVENNLTALHMLALKPLEENTINRWEYAQWNMVRELWLGGRKLEYKKRLELITEPSIVLFDAVKSGNFDFVEAILIAFPKQWELKDPKTGQNLLHIAVLFRQNRIIDTILDIKYQIKLTTQLVDKDCNNVLHFAAHQLQDASSISLRPDILMQRELAWFKEVEKRVPPEFRTELRTMRNKDGKTPMDTFHANHRKLSDEVKDTAKAVANTGMVVAALIVAVAFAAALTTPGDKNSAWFTVFIMANAVALFTSSSSIVAFLSIFTSSRFTEGNFVISLYPNLIIGKTLLFISLVTMVIAFAATSFLIFDHIHKWVAYAVASFGLLTISMFLGLHLSIFDALLDYFWSRYDHGSKVH